MTPSAPLATPNNLHRELAPVTPAAWTRPSSCWSTEALER